jgi:hypothetical protein
MATIIESGLWTLTNDAAERMAADGLIRECSADHTDINPIDKPIYHRALNAPDWFGSQTIGTTIISYHTV